MYLSRDKFPACLVLCDFPASCMVQVNSLDQPTPFITTHILNIFHLGRLNFHVSVEHTLLRLFLCCKLQDRITRYFA